MSMLLCVCGWVGGGELCRCVCVCMFRCVMKEADVGVTGSGGWLRLLF